MELNQVSRICKALSDPNRLQVIELLTGGEQCACELLEKLRISQPTLSHHMKTLEECGLVTSRKSGKWSHYSLNCGRWTAFRDYIESIRCTCSAEEKGGCGCV